MSFVFKKYALIKQMLILVAACIVFGFIFSFFGAIIPTALGSTDPHSRSTLIWIQAFSSIGMFLAPSIFYAYLFSPKVTTGLKIDTPITKHAWILGLVAFVAILPFSSLLEQWNASISFPETIKSLEIFFKKWETLAAESTERLLDIHTIPALLGNIVVMALIPAVAEEFLFRGTLQQAFQKQFKNVHIAVWIAAFIFSAFHLQFFGFFPRLLIGIALGYIFAYSNNIWIPIGIHFLNNLAIVIMDFLNRNYHQKKYLDHLEITPFVLLFSIFGLLVSMYCLYMIKRNKQTEIRY